MIYFTLRKALIKRIKKIVIFFLKIAFLLNLCYLARSLEASAEIVAWVMFIVKRKVSSGKGLLNLYKDKGNLFFTNNEINYNELDKNLVKNFDVRSLGVSLCK